MSRYVSEVPAEKAAKVFGIKLLKKDQRAIDAGLKVTVRVAHGFDTPCASYFCDLEPDCEIGIYYGGIGLTREVERWDYVAAMNELGLKFAADSVTMDVPYQEKYVTKYPAFLCSGSWDLQRDYEPCYEHKEFHISAAFQGAPLLAWFGLRALLPTRDWTNQVKAKA